MANIPANTPRKGKTSGSKASERLGLVGRPLPLPQRLISKEAQESTLGAGSQEECGSAQVQAFCPQTLWQQCIMQGL